MLSGCGFMNRFVPVPPPAWPSVPSTLTERCPDLKTIEGNEVAITELLKAVVDNYNLYYLCQLKNDGWNEWYKTQQKIYEDFRNKSKK